MKILIFVFSLFICSNVFAQDTEVYVFTDYTPVRVMYLLHGADVDLEASKAGLSGAIKKINPSELPKDRAGRDFWKIKNGGISIDTQLKKKSDDENAARISNKTSAIEKLKSTGLTDEEIAALLGDK